MNYIMDKKRIALLSNIMIDMVSIKLRAKYEVYTPGGFNAWISEVLDKSAELYRGNHDAVFLILDGTELKSESPEMVEDKITLWKSGAEKLVESIRDIPVFISTVDFQESKIKTFEERKYDLFWSNNWYEFLWELSRNRKNLYVLDLMGIISDIGRQNFYSRKMWYMGSMPYSKEGICAVVAEIESAMDAAFIQRKKVLVLDLDNTLWGGVIGEDGVDGIELSDHKEGARFYDFQKQILEMKRRGTVLAIASKNNESDAEEGFRHPFMLLKKEDFVLAKINWQDKSVNLKAMETELNLTEGAFVFVDDSALERQIMKGQCVDVAVPEFPADTTSLSDFGEAVYKEYFRQLRTTDEDLKKTQMYQGEARRKQIQSRLDIDEYINALGIRADIHRMCFGERDRVWQLCNKTNQFNLTTKRYTMKELEKLAVNADIFTVETSDRFGDNGLVAVIICKRYGSNVEIDSFLMSCRVMGRKLENVIIGALMDIYENCEKLIGTYIPTVKNSPVKDLYERLGFVVVDETDGVKQYELKISNAYPRVKSYSAVSIENRGIDS